MHKCRICLQNKKNVKQINELHEGISYAIMLNYVADIKIREGDIQVICYLCCKKLKNSYFFKLLIIRSNQEWNVNSKVLKFDSIKEVKAQILKKYLTTSNEHEVNKTIIDNPNDYTFYNDTLIQRFVNVKERLTSIYNLKKNNEEDYEDTPYDSETNYQNYNYEKIEKKEIDKKCDKKYKNNQLIKNVLIKPKYLEDLRIIPSKGTLNQVKKSTKTKQKVKREDICPYCGKKTRYIKTHILIHTASQKFECNDCRRKFYTKPSLEQHIKSHTKKHIFKCDKCIATFNTKGCLNRHLHTHSDVREFKCHICNKAFKWKKALHRHILIHNINAKSIRCELCNMSFFNKYTLKVHTRVHTGERPYKCELCSKPYSYKRDFNRHCLNKHGVFLDRRSVYIMNEETLNKEKVLMNDLMLHVNGIPTEREPLDSFKGPQKALAFANAVKVMQDRKVTVMVE